MLELTDKQKEEAQRTLDMLLDFWWRKIKDRMNDGLSFDAALNELMGKILDGES